MTPLRSDSEVIGYFIEQSNARFDKIEEKLDQLMQLRAQITLIAAVASAVVSLLVAVFSKSF